jgi:hypothetical protein
LFLYSIRQFAVLARLLIAGGPALALWMPDTFATGGWFGGVVLAGFAMTLYTITAGDAKPSISKQPAG